jgi:hypothetical protein
MKNSKFWEEKKEWLEALLEVKAMTNINLPLTFNQDTIPISMSITHKHINVDPRILKYKTSKNFKIFSLLHEMKHFENLHGINYLEYLCLADYYEMKANRSAWEILSNKYGESIANEIVIDFIRDRLTLQKEFNFKRKFNSIEEYIEEYFPFIAKELENYNKDCSH